MSTISNNSDFMLELVTENEAISEFKEATSSVVINPAVTWAKFILTDDLPNINKQRVPFEEFDNLIKSGIFMPIKMARGAVNSGHEKSEPLGTITNLKQDVVDGRNVIVGLAALWSRERPEDIKYIKDEAAEGRPPKLSWEILFHKSTKNEDGVEDLHDVVLKASTIVGKPAYGDRTPILAFAAKGSSAYLDELSDESFLLVTDEDGVKNRKFPFLDRSGNLDKELLASSIEEIKSSVSDDELKNSLLSKAQLVESNDESEQESNDSTEENILDELEVLKEELKKALADLDLSRAEIKVREDALAAKETELETLREFKASVEAEATRLQKLETIKGKFASAGVAKDDKYFEEHGKSLLDLSDEALDFMLQELVSFSAIQERNSSVNVPAIVVEGGKVTSNIKAIAEALRNLEK
jgi:hypothetical protein